MRLRYVDDAHGKIDAHERLLANPEQYKGKWSSLFKKEQPLYVEFGGGKGGFIIGVSEKHPEANFLTFERNAKVVYKSIAKLEEISHDNFFIVWGDVTDVEKIFEPKSIDRIYLNFSDPWPKDRHAKRRLTHGKFLNKYKSILKDGGELHFKTDNDGLFEYSLESFKENGWELTYVTHDLHQTDQAEDNVMTEYEAKFSSKGKNIHKLIAKNV